MSRSGSAFRVAFDEPAAGWLGIELMSGDQRLFESFSHVYPSLSDLCSALCNIAGGVTARAVVFLLEPTELELGFERLDEDSLRVTVRRFPDRRRARAGELLFDRLVTRNVVVLAFWRALRRLETLLPEEEFRAAFREPFPKLEMASLTRLVSDQRLRTQKAQEEG